MDRLISDVKQASCSNKVKLVIVEGIMIYDDRLVHTILSTLVDSSPTQTTIMHLYASYFAIHCINIVIITNLFSRLLR